jgi:hypothetical protein
MITLNRISTVMTVVVLFLFILSACSEKEVSPQVETAPDKVSDEVAAQFVKLGFDVKDIRLVPDNNPSGESGKKNYLLEGDIIITPENLQAMLGSDIHYKGAVNEQYRTSNLVSGSPYRIIRVLGYNYGSNALDAKMVTGLQYAIANYNALYGAYFGFRFTLTFGSNTTAKDIVVYKVAGSAGGQAGFPTGGNPYKWVQIKAGTSAYSTNVVEHVITHEIGHCLGLRHTDWFNRSLSCGAGGNEGSAGVGVIHVPGTPTGYDANSVMLSCFNSSETGEFGYYDIVALRYLY